MPHRRRKRRAAASRRRYEEDRVRTPLVDLLEDPDLERLNGLLPWRCFTVDSHGRPFGRPAWEGKRTDPQPVPDSRIELFDQRFDLSDKHVLEIGCFEGVHTVALCARARQVTAIDSRVENVVKTIVRAAFFDENPRVLTLDLEGPPADGALLQADLCHHVGVLYHLTDPVRHLQRLGDWIARGLLLDTHYALPGDAAEHYTVDSRTYGFRRFRESGRADAFSGMRHHSKWLLLDDIVGLLQTTGFDEVEVVEEREERNGPRALLFAERTQPS